MKTRKEDKETKEPLIEAPYDEKTWVHDEDSMRRKFPDFKLIPSQKKTQHKTQTYRDSLYIARVSVLEDRESKESKPCYGLHLYVKNKEALKAKKIPKDTYLIEYTGKRTLSKSETGISGSYIVNHGTIYVNAENAGNGAGFANTGEEPNCILTFDEGDKSFYIQTLVDIPIFYDENGEQRSTQIIVDYNSHSFHDEFITYKIATQAHHSEKSYQEIYDENKEHYINLEQVKDKILKRDIRKLLDIEKNDTAQAIYIPTFMAEKDAEEKSTLTSFNVNNIIFVGKKVGKKFIANPKQLELNALMHACYKQDSDQIEKLIAAGADSRHAMDFSTLLHFVLSSRNTSKKSDIFNLILRRKLATPMVEDRNQETIYHLLVKQTDPHYLKLLQNLFNEFNFTVYDFSKSPIKTAFEFKNIPAAAMLITTSIRNIIGSNGTLKKLLNDKHNRSSELEKIKADLIVFIKEIEPLIKHLDEKEWEKIKRNFSSITLVKPIRHWLTQIKNVETPADVLTTMENIDTHATTVLAKENRKRNRDETTVKQEEPHKKLKEEKTELAGEKKKSKKKSGSPLRTHSVFPLSESDSSSGRAIKKEEGEEGKEEKRKVKITEKGRNFESTRSMMAARSSVPVHSLSSESAIQEEEEEEEKEEKKDSPRPIITPKRTLKKEKSAPLALSHYNGHSHPLVPFIPPVPFSLPDDETNKKPASFTILSLQAVHTIIRTFIEYNFITGQAIPIDQQRRNIPFSNKGTTSQGTHEIRVIIDGGFKEDAAIRKEYVHSQIITFRKFKIGPLPYKEDDITYQNLKKYFTNLQERRWDLAPVKFDERRLGLLKCAKGVNLHNLLFVFEIATILSRIVPFPVKTISKKKRPKVRIYPPPGYTPCFCSHSPPLTDHSNISSPLSFMAPTPPSVSPSSSLSSSSTSGLLLTFAALPAPPPPLLPSGTCSSSSSSSSHVMTASKEPLPFETVGIDSDCPEDPSAGIRVKI